MCAPGVGVAVAGGLTFALLNKLAGIPITVWSSVAVSPVSRIPHKQLKLFSNGSGTFTRIEMIQISASLLASDLACLGEKVRRADQAGVDSFHIDLMDGHYVFNLAFSPDYLAIL
jgi:hypothetical protein